MQCILKQVKYNGALAATSDCTVLVSAILYDAQAGVVVGAVGDVQEVTSHDQVKECFFCTRSKQSCQVTKAIYITGTASSCVPPLLL